MYKRKDGYWAQSIPIQTPHGTKYKTIYAKSVNELKQKIKQNHAQEPKGELFEDVATEWYEAIENDVSLSTRDTYGLFLDSAIQYFKKQRIQSIEPKHIAALYDDYAFTHRASKNTMGLLRTVMNQIFKYAIRHGYTLNNPCRDVQLPKHLKQKKVTPPTPEEIEKIKKNTDTKFGLLMNMLLYTGMRRSEALALTYEDIDFTNRLITVNKSLYNKTVETPVITKPKTENSIRKVPLLNKLYDILPKDKTGIIFKTDKGKYWHYSYFTSAQKKYRRTTGVTCNCHQLRHAFATILYENHIEPKDTQIILGHKDLNTTLNFYTTVRDSRIKQLAQQMQNIDFA